MQHRKEGRTLNEQKSLHGTCLYGHFIVKSRLHSWNESGMVGQDEVLEKKMTGVGNRKC